MTATLFLRNKAGRRGVPLRRSFERWIAAVPGMRRRGKVEINLLIVGSREARRFNREFRVRDYATNVLSFRHEPLPGQKTALLGELVICAPVVAREAAEQGKRLPDHYAHLTIHGVLHLLGHDHESESDATRMEQIERRILAGLHIRDPYAPAGFRH
jgi:probable rRNA maturation factor